MGKDKDNQNPETVPHLVIAEANSLRTLNLQLQGSLRQHQWLERKDQTTEVGLRKGISMVRKVAESKAGVHHPPPQQSAMSTTHIKSYVSSSAKIGLTY